QGGNHYQFLHPETNKFVFVPGELEQSFANSPFQGSADQQADLSLTHPYGRENKLTDRLLAVKEFSDKYKQVLKDLAATCFTRERLLADIEAVEKTAKEPLAKEAKAASARKEAPGGKFGKPLELRAFVDKRIASV